MRRIPQKRSKNRKHTQNTGQTMEQTRSKRNAKGNRPCNKARRENTMMLTKS